jgi:N-methylhydantoinase B
MYIADNPSQPIEQVEQRNPWLRVHAYRLLRDSGGRGLHRGGPGLESITETLWPAFVTANQMRTKEPAWGLAGGEPGKPSEIHMRLPGSTTWQKQPGRVWWKPVPKGTLLRVRTGGGGGWGKPPSAAKRKSPAARAGKRRSKV